VLERGDDVYRDLETWFASPLNRQRLNETDLGFGPPVDLADFTDPKTLALVGDRNAADLQIWLHVAERRGLGARRARSIADSAFGAAIGKVVIAHAQPVPRDPSARHPLDRAPFDAINEAPPEDAQPSTPGRLVRLVRRGPRAIRDRMLAEVAHRRTPPRGGA
jgi:hypothetical protein